VVDISSIPDSPVFADIISGALGEESPFHREFGYCADGVEFCTAIFPDGWENRLLKTILEDATVFFQALKIWLFPSTFQTGKRIPVS